MTELTDAPVSFGLIPADNWYQPDWIDEEKATKAREDMVKNQVIYGGASIHRSPELSQADVLCFSGSVP